MAGRLSFTKYGMATLLKSQPIVFAGFGTNPIRTPPRRMELNESECTAAFGTIILTLPLSCAVKQLTKSSDYRRAA